MVDGRLNPIKVSPDPVTATQSFKVWFKAPETIKKGWWWRVQVTLDVENAAGGGECERFVLAPSQSYGKKITTPRRKGKRVTLKVALPAGKAWCPLPEPRPGWVDVRKQNRSLQNDGDGAQGVAFPYALARARHQRVFTVVASD
ncbi:MAG: hypothetical protein QM679_01010 [Patulibacter sp.]